MNTTRIDADNSQMPDITFEPPTPLNVLDSAVQTHQSIPHNHARSNDTGTLACEPHYVPMQQKEGSYRSTPTSPYSPLPDHIFAWQDSKRHSTPEDCSRPNSVVSGCSVSGTSYSGEYLTSYTESTRSTSVFTDGASSPSQGGKSKSHAKKRAPGHISRPRNAFILFRSHAITNDLIPSSFGVKDNRAVSCIVASLWHSLPDEERNQWRVEAQLEKEEHQMKYPYYQFKPDIAVSSKSKPRQHAKAEESVKEQCVLIADQILKSHGRTVAAPKAKRREVRSKKGSNKKDKVGLPRARKSARGKAAMPRDANEEKVPPSPVLTRRRTSSAPDSRESREQCLSPVSSETSPLLLYDSWQEPIANPNALSASFDSHFSSFQRHVELLREGTPHSDKSRRPSSLDLKNSNKKIGSHDEQDIVSPHTILESLYSEALTHQSEPLLRCKSDTTPAANRSFFPLLDMSSDAMLVSPMQATFSELKRDSLDYQWSRLSISHGISLHSQRRSRCLQGSESTLSHALGGSPRHDRERATEVASPVQQSVQSPSSHIPESSSPHQSLSFPADVFNV